MVAIRANVTKQVSVQRDGIWMTPDALDPERGLIESYKMTRRSLRNARTQADFEANHWIWCGQEQAYALACGVDTCRWIVLWQAGDYSRGVGSGPQMLECTATWTAEELVSNWQTVLMHAEGLR